MIGKMLQLWRTSGCRRGEGASHYFSVENELTNDVCKDVLYTRDIHLPNRILPTTYEIATIIFQIWIVESLACLVKLNNFPKVTMLEIKYRSEKLQIDAQLKTFWKTRQYILMSEKE